MLFEVTYSTDCGGRRRKRSIIMEAGDFHACLKNALGLYGKSLCKIVYDPKQNYAEEEL